MDTVTYPDHRVAQFIEQHFIPARVRTKENPDLLQEYFVTWTPNVVVSDERGKVHYRIEGYLPPEDFIARLALGAGKYHIDRGEFDLAAERFEEVSQRHEGSEAGAEALYWLGVARFKKSHDKADLSAIWKRLGHDYPDSDWTKRSQVPS